MRISEAELSVMKVLWAEPGLGAAEVAKRVTDHDWSDKTVKTLLARLVEKGALKAEPEGRRYLYTPLIARKEYRKSQARSFVDSLFGGRAAPLIAHLAEAKDLSDEDIAELEDLVRRLKDDRH
ncbi:MAG: BlaI/MecI/CopY family transcriptional regulator [Parvularcula sp.]|jgi:predicted transcriptional regulator|nr:BlaI/MecI/CopY family transcriptional regulator [Parvularcula sp.]